MPKSSGTGQRRKPHTNLIALRLQKGLSREALGGDINVARETIRMAEAGWVPTPRVQFALARAFTVAEARAIGMDIDGEDVKRRLTPLELWPMRVQHAVPTARKAAA